MVWDEPAIQFSPPFGEVNVIVDWIIMNVPLLWSVTLELLVSITLTRQFEEVSSGTIQEYDPAEAGVLTMIVVQFIPLSVEYSSLTFVTPELVQVMFCDVPPVHTSPPLGEFRLIVEESWMVNEPSLWSVTLELTVSVILTRQFEEETSGTVQEYEPLDALVLPTI